MSQSIIFEDDYMATIVIDVFLYILAPYLDYHGLSALRSVDKHWNNYINKYLTIYVSRKFVDPDLTYQDGLWFITKFLQQKSHVTQSIALNHYRITKKELNTLEYKESCNPIYKSASPMKLYDLNDIISLCLKRHKNVEGLIAYREKLDISKTKRKNTINNKKESRKEELKLALDEFKVPLRDDSKLVELYIENKTDLSLPQVIRRLSEVYYLFNYCNIQSTINKIKKRKERDKKILLADWENEFAHEDYHSTWDNVDFVTLAERELNIVYPTEWPWLGK